MTGRPGGGANGRARLASTRIKDTVARREAYRGVVKAAMQGKGGIGDGRDSCRVIGWNASYQPACRNSARVNHSHLPSDTGGIDKQPLAA